MMKKYYIINLEQMSTENTLVFWRPNGKGYTSDLTKAGLYDKKEAEWHILKGRDLALTRNEIKEKFEVRRITFVRNKDRKGFRTLFRMKKEKQKELKEKGEK